jgi:molybdenum cofactor synthesis domain-containing protein
VVGVSERKQFRQLAPPERVHGVIGDLDLGGGTETVPLDAARERVLARRIDAAIDVPGFDRAALDGYAVRARDTFGASEAEPATLAVAGRVETGETPGVEVGPGRAVEVSTGAVLPREADAVARVERTDRRDGDRVAVRTAVTPGEGVMEAGADIAAGQRALGPGTRLSPRQVGLLAALGVDEVPVRRRPRVGIISTGDELIPPGDDLDHRQGEIHDVNGHTIAAGVEEAGGEPRVYPHAGDEYGEIDDLLRSAADDCDLVLSSGSTSASAADVVYRVVEERGDLLIHGVAVKPGKPMLVGTVAGTPCVGLPGYPVSALTIFRTFVAPAIREAAGLAPARTASVRGEMAVRERYAGGRLRFVPVGLVRDGDGDSLVYPVDRGSGATTSLVEADGVVEMPADTEYLAAGETVEVRLFSAGSRPPALLAVGEDDPAFSRLLDGLRRPRFLRVGSAGGVRQLRDGLPDVGVVAGPVDTDVDAGTLGGWTREWGLVVAPGNPEEIDGPGDLADRDLRFVNRSRESGLRASLDADLADVAAARGSTVEALTDAVDGYDLARRAHESPARLVAAGDADAGLGLRATATDLDLGFVSLGTQPVRILANPDRTDKEGVRALSATLPATNVLEGLAGFEPPS